jgi:hypothetical protein
LSGASASLQWRGGRDATPCLLDFPINLSADAYPRARYLSQQFVEDLCSIEGMPSLIREIERVIFEAHPVLERDGAADFDELLDSRASIYRDTRAREASALASISDQIGVEMEKAKQVITLSAQVGEKEKLITRYQQDRASLLPKTQNKAAQRLQQVLSAADSVRGYIRYYSNQQMSLGGVNTDLRDLRQNRAPAALRSMQDQYQRSGISPDDWRRFLLDYRTLRKQIHRQWKFINFARSITGRNRADEFWPRGWGPTRRPELAPSKLKSAPRRRTVEHRCDAIQMLHHHEPSRLTHLSTEHVVCIAISRAASVQRVVNERRHSRQQVYAIIRRH